jgi:hypothetical protein
MKNLAYLLLNCIFVIGLSGFAQAQHTFVEEDGTVAIEAEHYSNVDGPWELVEGRTAMLQDTRGHGSEPGMAIKFENSDHPIAGNFTGTLAVRTSRGNLNWGFAADRSAVVATFSHDPNKAAIFAYDAGDEMAGMKAPARRVGIFQGGDHLSADAWTIYENAVKWAAGKRKPEILFVVSGLPPGDEDDFTAGRLSGNGMNVEPIGAEEAAGDMAKNYDLVLISESVSSEAASDKFKDVNTPVVVTEPYIYDDMNMVEHRALWSTSEGQNGNAMLIRHSGIWTDYLRYGIYFDQAGEYNMWILGHNAGDSRADDPVFFFDDVVSSDKPHFEITLAEDLRWVNKTPGGSSAAINVPESGWYNLYLAKGAEPEQFENPPLSRRYPNWRLDKIVLTQNSGTPEGDGPVETINHGSMNPPDSITHYSPFLPDQIWVEQDNYVIMEAENIDHHRFWKLRGEPDGFTGSGYLEWQGPNRTRSIEGAGGNHDSLGVAQGPQEEWLILRVDIQHPGRYAVNARNIHEHEDGDNDAWVTKVGFVPDPEKKEAISRMGDSHDDGTGFTWLDWGVREFDLKKGVNNLYIGGRSVGFGIDRIAIYKVGESDAESAALDIDTPESLLKK